MDVGHNPVTYVGSKLIHLSHWIPAFAGMTMFVMLLLQILYLWHCHLFRTVVCLRRYDEGFFLFSCLKILTTMINQIQRTYKHIIKKLTEQQ
ncbi:hypothetical protein MNBD_GAMMA08-436 [hydrothermal vent metagenome]|uniref:Uncharacterized protein n=1 Tax=hydrothermal vent metagenome TaxID=652676 RepID=A0A3B0WXX3_9ZZZZ